MPGRDAGAGGAVYGDVFVVVVVRGDSAYGVRPCLGRLWRSATMPSPTSRIGRTQGSESGASGPVGPRLAVRSVALTLKRVAIHPLPTAYRDQSDAPRCRK